MFFFVDYTIAKKNTTTTKKTVKQIMQYNQFLLQNIFIGRRANDSFRVRSLKWSNFIQHTHTHTTHIGVTFNLDELLESGLCGNSNTTIKRENTSEKIHNKSWNIFVANYNP